ncbi:MAG: SPOR domain-containing protein, partial [Gemmatimonadota bacterium]|nr:SPOR domain-containing protein [Gemmatimonadota bacterium]
GELLFVVVPSVANGQTWYRTVAGPARDVAEIPGIQERIERAGLRILAGRTGWFPRRTGLAFLLTEELTVDDADALAGRYRDEGIPAYVLAVDYSAGVRRYRVYAGGYAYEDEAAPLARILTEAGIDAPLVPRLGSMPSAR